MCACIGMLQLYFKCIALGVSLSALDPTKCVTENTGGGAEYTAIHTACEHTRTKAMLRTSGDTVTTTMRLKSCLAINDDKHQHHVAQTIATTTNDDTIL